MSPEQKRLVFPGDELAASEEVLPGEGTYDDGQNVRAARLGYFHIDPDEFRAVVDAATDTPAVCRPGDVVVGRVYMVRPAMAGIQVIQIIGSDRQLSGDTNGTLHVSKVANRYVEDVGNEYRLEDLVRCGVVDVEPSLQLTTDFDGGGCIKAFCLGCRHGLLRAANGLECPNCGRREMRNIARDYGYGVVALDESAPPLARPAQDRGRDGRGRGAPRGGRGGSGGRVGQGGRSRDRGRGPPRRR